MDQLTRQVTANIEMLNGVVAKDLPSLQDKLQTAGIGTGAAKPVAPPKKV